ncbi:F-box domain [Arabidopsis thaliana x Arabidopsis arenosa]|uniref:F-box domain n=1 Tax=Arabidopsis thaliana x Arabidopsis arenosa TaxID=1240361 RepID=A0A8T2B3V4_9BRAS|nr:F-box domain [Arabidopsis thaliana x Arabidopsis arenosa]
MANDSGTDGVRAPTQSYGRQNHLRRRISRETLDLISSLPDVILHDILSFMPTKFAIRTSLLSKRWRHVWCETPSLSFDKCSPESPSLNEILTRYTAPKMVNFHLHTIVMNNIPHHINRWIKLVMSRNVENISLDLWNHVGYKFPDFFYINSSVKQIRLKLSPRDMMVPRGSVSWTSLRKLYLDSSSLSDESMAKILSGCPILERLKLCFCNALKILDLNKSMRLRTLEINSDPQFPRTLQIVAPYIHCLILKSSHHLPCVLVDVSSLVEARLNISIASVSKTKNDSLQVMVLNMLEKLQNVEKLTFVGGNLLKILSMAELRGVPFPMFKFKSLTLERVIFRYVIPGIERVLKNSPNLKKLHTKDCYHKQRVYLGDYVDLQAFNLDQCWRSKYGEVWYKSCLDQPRL